MATTMEDLPTTLPEGVMCSVQGFEGDSEETVRAFWDSALFPHLVLLSKIITLSSLDGVTVTFDMAGAVEDLDFGFDAKKRMPTNDSVGFCVGVAQPVVRDGQLKSHVILYHPAIRGLAESEEKSESYKEALYTLAHECAHVAVTASFHKAFPDVLMQVDGWDRIDHARWTVAIWPCWNEYAACYISGTFYEEVLGLYADVFLKALEESKSQRMVSLRRCFKDKDWQRAWDDMAGLYGKLMRYACYVLGTMHSADMELDDVPRIASALQGHWFQSSFLRIGEICKTLMDSRGEWKDKSEFEPLGDLLEEILFDKGISIKPHGDGYWIDVNFPPAVYRP